MNRSRVDDLSPRRFDRKAKLEACAAQRRAASEGQIPTPRLRQRAADRRVPFPCRRAAWSRMARRPRATLRRRRPGPSLRRSGSARPRSACACSSIRRCEIGTRLTASIAFAMRLCSTISSCVASPSTGGTLLSIVETRTALAAARLSWNEAVTRVLSAAKSICSRFTVPPR